MWTLITKRFMTKIRVDTYFRHVLHNNRTGHLFHWMVYPLPNVLGKIVLFNMITIKVPKRVDAISYRCLYKFYKNFVACVFLVVNLTAF